MVSQEKVARPSRKKEPPPTVETAEDVETEKQPAVEAASEQPGPPKVPMTNQSFADEMNQLIDRAIADGLLPLPMAVTILAKRGMSLFDQGRAAVADVADRFLASLESGHAKAEKK